MKVPKHERAPGYGGVRMFLKYQIRYWGVNTADDEMQAATVYVLSFYQNTRLAEAIRPMYFPTTGRVAWWELGFTVCKRAQQTYLRETEGKKLRASVERELLYYWLTDFTLPM